MLWLLCTVRSAKDACWQVVAGASFMNFRNDMALGGNLATQFAATPETQARLPHLLAKQTRIRACQDLTAGSLPWGRPLTYKVLSFRAPELSQWPGARAGGIAAEPELQGCGVGDAARDLA